MFQSRTYDQNHSIYFWYITYLGTSFYKHKYHKYDIKVGHPSNPQIFTELSFQFLTRYEIIRKYAFDVYYIFYLRVPWAKQEICTSDPSDHILQATVNKVHIFV